MRDHWSGDDGGGGGGDDGGGRAPGKRTLTAALQRRAADGVRGGGGEVPHRAALEAGFGVDLGHVRAHTGEPAAQASRALGADAYTYGTDIAFAGASPAKELVAHEVAHVIQQQSGAAPDGGVGAAGDAYEVEADREAAVVAGGGRSDLAARRGAGGGGAAAVQCFESNEHKRMGDDGAGGAMVELAPGFRVSFGDITAMAGDWFESVEQIRRLAAHAGDGRSKPGTRDEILFVLRTQVDHVEHEDAYDPALQKVVKERYYRMASFNPTHFSPGQVNNAGSYRQNHQAALEAAAAAGKKGEPRDAALLHEGFASHFLTDGYSGGHVRTPRAEVEAWWNERAPTFWTSLHGWMAERIAKHIHANHWLGGVLTKDVLWQVTRDRVAKTLREKGIPAMTFGSVVSGAIHDADNHDGVLCKVGDETVRLVGDGEVLDERGRALVAGVDTAKKAAAAVKVSLKDVDQAYAAGAAGKAPAAAAQAVRLPDGRYRAEQLWPRALPDAAAGQTPTPRWQLATVDDLFAEPTLRAALRRFANNKAAILGKELKMDDAYQQRALEQAVLRRLEGDEGTVLATFREILDYVPDTGGEGVLGGVDNASDDNAMEQYRKARDGKALGTLTRAQRGKIIRHVMDGNVSAEEREAAAELLDSAAPADAIAIVDDVQFDNLWRAAKSVRLAQVAGRAGYFVRFTSNAQMNWIKTASEGRTGEADQELIVTILEGVSDRDLLKGIIEYVGDGALNFDLTGAHQRRYDAVKQKFGL